MPPATSALDDDDPSSACQFWQTDVGSDDVVHDSCCAERDVEDASSVLQADLFTDSTNLPTSGIDKSNQSGFNRASNSRLQDLPASTEGNV